MSEDCARDALTFGSCDGVLDHPAGEKTDTPYLTLYTPEARIDWELDAGGKYKWVKYREKKSLKVRWDLPRIDVTEFRIITAPVMWAMADGKPKGYSQYYRHYFLDSEEIVEWYNADTGNWVNVETVDIAAPVWYDFDEMPVVRFEWGHGMPWVLPMVAADLKAFIKESDFDWDVFIHAHPWILAWLYPDEKRPDASPLERLRIGANWAMPLKPAGPDGRGGQEDVKYCQPNSAPMEVQMRSIQDARDLARRMAGNESDVQIRRGIQPVSGVALAYEEAARSKNFNALARDSEKWEAEILRIAGNEMGIGGALPSVAYPSEFDQRSIDELSRHMTAAAATKSLTAWKEMAKRLDSRLLGQGASEITIKAVYAEIDKQTDDVFAVKGDGESSTNSPGAKKGDASTKDTKESK
jgi:hypothetical protein